MKKVVILYKFLPQWRVDFFNKLRQELSSENIILDVCYGKMNNEKNDEVKSNWGKFIENKYLKFGKFSLIWQPAIKYIKDADLVIVEQANKLLFNYYLILRRIFTKKKFAFWGHGINLQEDSNSISNKFKRIYSNQTDWWFAYTDGVKKRVIQMGFPEEKISVLNNTIDIDLLMEEYNKIDREKILELKKQYNIGNGPIGLYCGGMYKEKRLDFLLESCKKIKADNNNFEMLFIGSGPEAEKIEKASNAYNWIHYLGSMFNEQRVPFFYMSDIFLMPDAVGLAIIDSFVMQTPMITSNYSNHGPEIEYLENGINGIMTNNNVKDYSEEVINLLNDKTRLSKLKENCKIFAEKYPLENMVNSFKDGIIKVLEIN